MNRRHSVSVSLVSVSLAVIVLAMADRSVRAEPPVMRAPQATPVAPRPAAVSAVDPHAAAVVQAARQNAASVAAHPSLIDAPKAALQSFEKADGPTLVLTASAPLAAGKARLWLSSGAALTQWDTESDAVIVNNTCPVKMGMSSNICSYDYFTGMTVIMAQIYADSVHGYLVNCFISNAGPDSVAFIASTTVASGHGAWFSADFKPGSLAPGWGGGANGMMIATSPPMASAYSAVFTLTRCEVTPYTVPPPNNPSGGH